MRSDDCGNEGEKKSGGVDKCFTWKVQEVGLSIVVSNRLLGKAKGIGNQVTIRAAWQGMEDPVISYMQGALNSWGETLEDIFSPEENFLGGSKKQRSSMSLPSLYFIRLKMLSL